MKTFGKPGMLEKNKTAILVAGMHRSGTSAFTRLLALFGCDLPKSLVPGNRSNKLGHWEPKSVVDLNEEILTSAKSSWDDWKIFDPHWRDSPAGKKFLERALTVLEKEFAGSLLFVLKDPRICRLLPFWIDVLQTFGAEPLIVSPIRNPLDVALSLEKRDGITPLTAYFLWLRHVLDAEQASRGLRRAWLNYDELLLQPYATINMLGSSLGITWPQRKSANIQIEIDDWISLELRHHYSGYAELVKNSTIPHWIVSSFEIFNRWCHADMKDNDIEKLRRIKTEFDTVLLACDREVAELNARVGTLGDALASRDREVAELNARVGTLGDALASRDREVAELNARVGTLGDALASRDREVAELNARVGTLGDALASRDREVAELNARVGTLGDALASRDREVAERTSEIKSIYTSRSWRITAPLRVLRQMQVALTRRVCGNIAKTVRVAWHQIPLSSAAKASIKNFIFERVPIPFLTYSGRYRHWQGERRNIALYKKAEDTTSWGIMATRHTLFVAKAIERQLQSHGWGVNIMTASPDKFFHDYYIVICPQIFDKLPPYEKLISFQMEQTVSSRWFSSEYLSILQNSYAVLEYATHNFPFLEKMKIAFPHVHYLPVCGLLSYGNTESQVEKTYEVLFYGDNLSSPRRQWLLSELKTRFHVLIINDVFGSSLERMIQSARIVVNLHHYEDGLLEVPRIWQCLSLGIPVVSETSKDQEEYPELKSVVTFFEQGSIDSMMSSVIDTLKNPPSKQKMLSAISASNKRFSFMFDRFLVATGFLSSAYASEMSPPIPLTNKVIISMPETFIRRQGVSAEPLLNNWSIFDGIRRQPSWLGCGLSHYVIARQALRLGMKRIQIAEDDVIFEKNFLEKIKTVHKFLDERNDSWDLFCGLISDLHNDTKILSVENFDGMKFVTIDKMTSTVFNIYNQDFLRRIVLWNFTDLDPGNTIDRFIENLPNLKVIVSLPFLVRQNDLYESVLWGFNNKLYSEMISESENQLQKKVSQFNKGHA